VLAWSDFTVPDVLGFMLPAGSSPINVFPTEILLQWKQHATSRAVATGVPFMLVTGVLLVVALVFLRRSAVVAGGEGAAARARVPLSAAGRALGWLGLGAVLVLALVVPLLGVASWGLGRGETVARPVGGAVADAVQRTQAADELSMRWLPLILAALLAGLLLSRLLIPNAPFLRRLGPRAARRLVVVLALLLLAVPFVAGGLGDFSGALDRTPGSREDLVRWIKTGLGAALLAMLVAVVLVRWALRGGPLARGTVLFLAALPLAIPGLVFTVGTNLFWNHLDAAWIERGVLRSVLVLTARFLPFAVLAAWLALREARRGHEEAAALLGAGPATRAWRVWGALAGPGILGGALAVLVLALREVDAIIEIDARVFPLRIYDKIHFSRLADEANLAFLYVGILLVPALLTAVVLGALGRRRA
jgi:ABC-type Fe3+ transport system permease subunit